MTLKDEDLKLIYRAYISKRDPGTRQNCPSLEELSRFFEPRTRRRKKLKIVDHITHCPACTDEFEFLRELHNYESLLTQNAVEVRLKGQFRSLSPGHKIKAASLWRYATVATGALLLIVSLAIIMKWDRSDETRTVSPSLALLRPGPGQFVPIPMVFEWKTVEGADFYILEIFDETLLPVWKSPEVAASILKPPEDVSSRFRLNRPYHWMITAFRSGKRLAESELRRFTPTSKNP